MLVSELKPGMLLVPAGDNERWQVYVMSQDESHKWLSVRTKTAVKWQGEHPYPKGPVLYLGTKKDLNIDARWTNKFVLVDNEIYGVEPAAWRRMKPVVSK